ncbi:MAG: fasciclin domain-containing protein [Gemmatimonadaceae bacterium]
MRKTTFGAVAIAALLTLPAIASAQQHSAKENTNMKNIVQVAVDAGNFKTLVAALKAADLVGALEGPGPFTVFAPSDAAFAKLPAGTVEGLLANKEKLASILTFHVISGKVMAADVVAANGATPVTLNGESLNIVVRDGKVYVDGAQVVTADITASNGVIHVIDSVLIPTAKPATAGR